MSAEPASPVTTAAQHDAAVAVRNGFRLGLSLLATWTVALAVRFQLPRHLGPELFGRYNFCDALTGSFFTFLNFGIGTYIMREVAVRPKHVNDFFGGFLLMRTVLGALSLAVIAAFLHTSDRPRELLPLVLSFGLVYFVSGVNGYLSNILQAATRVGALARINVVAKIVWGMGLAGAIALDSPLYVLALPNLASELLKLWVLIRASREAVDLEFRVNVAATKAVLIASLPFYANGIAVELGGRVDVTMLELLSPGVEVGWYSAANNFAALAIMLSPVVGWVVMPMLARAHARSEDEFFLVLRQAMRAILVLAIPCAMTIALGADFWVELAFGRSFGPAIGAVRMLAFMFVATYAAILLSVALVILQRSWTLTIVSFISLGIELALIPAGVYLFRESGDGGAAIGAASGFAGAEFATVALLITSVGRKAFDRPMLSSLARSVILCAVTVTLHYVLADLGPWRLLLDMAFYAVGAFAIGAVSWPEALRLFTTLRNRRAGTSAG